MSQLHEVEAQMRTMILDMELGPGERLTERWAEAQFGASRTPIRAALLRLEADGLVCREGRGWMIAPLDVQEIEQLFVYREVLESAALKVGGRQIDVASLDALDALLDRYGKGISKEEAHKIGSAFHVQLAALSNNDFIVRGVADSITRLSRARWLVTKVDHHAWDEHRAIVAALRSGDLEGALQVSQRHIRESRDTLIDVLRSGRRSARARGILVRAQTLPQVAAVDPVPSHTDSEG